MKIKKIIMFLIVGFAVLAGINLAFSILSAQASGRVVQAYGIRRGFTLAGHEFRIASLELTRLARSYIVVGNEENLARYWHELLVDNRLNAVRLSFIENDASAYEIYLIDRALVYQESLRYIDAKAIAARTVGDYELALSLTYSQEYADYGALFVLTLDMLNTATYARTQAMVDDAERLSGLFQRVALAAIILFGATSVIGTSVLLRVVIQSMKNEQQSEEESRAKTRFLTHMSHEIRTPMNAVLGIVEIQLQKEGHPPETEDAFLRIYNSSSLLLNIINDILDLSRVVAGKMEIIPVAYDIASMIMDTVQLNQMHVGSKPIEFKLYVDPHLPVYLVGDELRIKQILNNLLSNAFKYTVAGTVELSFEVSELAESGEVTLIIKVADTGQGMTSGQIARLFQEYNRFNLKDNHTIEGTGLGMSIAHSLITLMQGSVEVESIFGKGSVFTVSLPQGLKDDETIGERAAQKLQTMEIDFTAPRRRPKVKHEPMPHGKVLVVDDVDINLFIVEGILSPYEISVDKVSSGHEAIAKIKDGNIYHIIFMDHMMPGIDGVETARIIRNLGYNHPIVALTANALKETQRMFIENGFSGFISKPIDVNEVHKNLVKFIRDKV